MNKELKRTLDYLVEKHKYKNIPPRTEGFLINFLKRLVLAGGEDYLKDSGGFLADLKSLQATELLKSNLEDISKEGYVDDISNKSIKLLKKLASKKKRKKTKNFVPKEVFSSTWYGGQPMQSEVVEVEFKPKPTKKTVSPKKAEPVKKAEPTKKAEPIKKAEPVKKAEPTIPPPKTPPTPKTPPPPKTPKTPPPPSYPPPKTPEPKPETPKPKTPKPKTPSPKPKTPSPKPKTPKPKTPKPSKRVTFDDLPPDIKKKIKGYLPPDYSYFRKLPTSVKKIIKSFNEPTRLEKYKIILKDLLGQDKVYTNQQLIFGFNAIKKWYQGEVDDYRNEVKMPDYALEATLKDIFKVKEVNLPRELYGYHYPDEEEDPDSDRKEYFWKGTNGRKFPFGRPKPNSWHKYYDDIIGANPDVRGIFADDVDESSSDYGETDSESENPRYDSDEDEDESSITLAELRNLAGGWNDKSSLKPDWTDIIDNKPILRKKPPPKSVDELLDSASESGKTSPQNLNEFSSEEEEKEEINPEPTKSSSSSESDSPKDSSGDESEYEVQEEELNTSDSDSPTESSENESDFLDELLAIPPDNEKVEESKDDTPEESESEDEQPTTTRLRGADREQEDQDETSRAIQVGNRVRADMDRLFPDLPEVLKYKLWIDYYALLGERGFPNDFKLEDVVYNGENFVMKSELKEEPQSMKSLVADTWEDVSSLRGRAGAKFSVSALYNDVERGAEATSEVTPGDTTPSDADFGDSTTEESSSSPDDSPLDNFSDEDEF